MMDVMAGSRRRGMNDPEGGYASWIAAYRFPPPEHQMLKRTKCNRKQENKAGVNLFTSYTPQSRLLLVELPKLTGEGGKRSHTMPLWQLLETKR
ncbi:MAG TPA: hypothetical protein VM571_00105 [Noviherbaspirillum sp.]|nr:hypothetical protein [Noviherbaspirillum sp.]